ncbi:MAG: hypothetical protein HQK52_22910 [Oligoflexia bacterium]|nr:hypothetical protein [Oligoflexia bacterium]
MSQNVKSFNEYRVIQITNDLLKYVNNAACNAVTAHEVEVGLWDRILEIRRTGLQCFFDKVGTGDLGESVELPHGRVIVRIEEKSEREYKTVFGKFTLTG